MPNRRRFARVGRILVAFLLIACGAACTPDRSTVDIAVLEDGQSCVVNGRKGACTSVVTLLVEDLAVSRGTFVGITPEGCGHAALARGEAVAARLREADFTNVLVLAFLSEPDKDCGP